MLAHYDQTLDTRVEADSSSFGIGCVIQQLHGQFWRPVAYASRALTPTEQRYAVIEKEAVSVVYACERFSQYLIGKHFTIATDHSPLVSLLKEKTLDQLPVRVQRLRIRLLRFSYNVIYVPGKKQVIADTLSRAPVGEAKDKISVEMEEYLQDFSVGFISSLPASRDKIEEIISEQNNCPTLAKVKEYSTSSWPSEVTTDLKQYFAVRRELTVVNGLLLKGSRIVIPTSMRQDVKRRIHEGHQGEVKCLQRARSSVWWPGISSHVTNMVKDCPVCLKERTNRPEPLMKSTFPDRPWQKVGSDLFQLNGKDYILVVDYYSRYIEVAMLTSSTSKGIIMHLKSIFARHGVPQTLVSDGATNYSSKEFKEFAEQYSFQHVISSPEYPQSNGESERAVRTIKEMWRKCEKSKEDPYLALLAYRSTPLQNGYSPAELLMSRKLRTTVPQVPANLQPALIDEKKVREREDVYGRKMAKNADRRGRAQALPKPGIGDKVYVKEKKKTYEVIEPHTHPRSYVLKGPDDEKLRRNRRQFVIIARGPEESQEAEEIESQEDETEESQDSSEYEEASEEIPQEPEAKKTEDPPIRVSTRVNKGKPKVRMNL